MKRALAVVVALSSSACIASGQDDVALPLFVAGRALESPVAGRDGASIAIERAQLAFGPLYLCAGAQAGELCDTARLEWLDSIVVEALDSEAREVGELTGITGTVRSWMFDLGITSLSTAQDPVVLPAAEKLGDASLRLEGEASVAGTTIPFAATLAIQQEEQTEAGIPIVRSSPSDAIDHAVEVDEAGLLVRFDAGPWVADIDFAALLEDESCQVDGAPIVCAATLEQICDADGNVTDSRDCAAEGMPCIVGQGCVASVDFDADSQGGRSIRTQVVAGPRPEFSWGFEP